MKNRFFKTPELKTFYILWSTQALSQLGSTMTSFALTLWLYQATGSALRTALLSICSYAPYVLLSVFAGALSDRWDKKKTMLVCDALAAMSTVAVFLLLRLGILVPWHLYLLNALNGLMNTVQSPASDVAITLITPRKYYQRASGLRSFSSSLTSILHPVLATALYALGGMNLVIAVDLSTFAVAFLSLLFFITLPEENAGREEESESLPQAIRGGLQCLRDNPLVLRLIFFLAGVNLVASAFDAALPAFVLPHPMGGEGALGLVTSSAGIAMLLGSLLVSALPAPKDRIRVILLTMVFSLTTDNFLMPLSSRPYVWCLAQVLGYLPVPLMNANLDVIVRSSIPSHMQGRVYACRNAFQFFTIPIGSFLGGLLIDRVCEPYIAQCAPESLAVRLFGQSGGSGAGLLIFCLGITAIVICGIFAFLLRPYHFTEPS
ncbi:MAG: MFS transporter [Clostridia bacterium]|nr:MFS transporter [Clostridia bacterium]